MRRKILREGCAYAIARKALRFAITYGLIYVQLSVASDSHYRGFAQCGIPEVGEFFLVRTII